jgi:heme A synthase
MNLTNASPARHRTPAATLYAVLVWLVVLAIVLQGLWAGIFLRHDGQRDAAGRWIDVHATGGEVALALTVLATIVAFLRLRVRRDFWIGGLVLAGLLVIEAYLGGLIRDDGKDNLTALHIPLAMLIMGWAAVLAARALRYRAPNNADSATGV